MPLYTFHLFNANDRAVSLEAAELPSDGGAFARAGELLADHMSCDRVEVWDGERAVLARHRHQPVIRPVGEAAQSAPARYASADSASPPG
jgi:hypothetical protein